MKKYFGELHGWTIDTDFLNKESIVYDIGLSTHIGYDLELIEEYACQIYGFDMDPKCKAWIETQTLPASFHFTPVGLGTKNGVQRFYDPYKATNVNVSSVKKNKTYQDLPIRTLNFMMKANEHTHIDLLKIDIEGGEFAILNQISRKKVTQLCIELHPHFFRFGFLKLLYARTLLYLKGFRLIHHSGYEYTFI